MNTQKLQPKFLLVTVIVLVFSLLRVLFPGFNSDLANYTPLGAIAIFGGAMFNNRIQSILIPVAIMFISDVIINAVYYDGTVNGLFHSTWFAVYGAFALIAIVSRIILKKVTFTNVILSAIVATLIHWIVTDTAVWLVGYNSPTSLYTNDFAGLVNCHIAAIPFEKNFLIGTLAYSAVMFGVFYVVKMKKPTLAIAKP